MELILSLILVVFGLFALSRVILRYKEGKFSLLHFMFWFVLWSSMLIVAVFPQIVDVFETVGIHANFLVYFSIILLLYLVFRVYVRVADTETKTTLLVRAAAIQNAKKKRSE